MKKLLPLLPILAALVLFNSCSDTNASKPVVPKEETYVEELAELGFSNTKIVIESIADKYTKATGLTFISDDSLNKYVAQNGFHTKHAEQYKGIIPEDKQRELVLNYDKLKSVNHYYWDNFFGRFIIVGQDRHGNADPFNRKGVWVVAPEEMFLPDPPNKDPMAIVKVDGGWLVLASW